MATAMQENFPILEQEESSFSQIEQIRLRQECFSLSLSKDSLITIGEFGFMEALFSPLS